MCMVDSLIENVRLQAYSLQRQRTDLVLFASFIANFTQSVLDPAEVIIEYKRSFADKMRRNPGVMQRIEVHCGNKILELRQGKSAPISLILNVARGVILSRQEVSLDIWLDSLLAYIDEQIQSNEQTRLKLQEFFKLS